MKAASTALIDLLGSSQNLYIAELVSITLADGTVFNWTTAPSDITYLGVTYSSKAALLQIGDIQWRIGIEVDVLKLQVWSDLSNVVESVAVQQATQQGLMDNALVIVQRLFTATWGNWSAGSVTLFRGNVSDTTCNQARVEFDIKSRKELFNIPFPYLRYQPGCQWPLYGAGCTLNPASFGINGTVAAGSIALLLNTSLTKPDQYFNEGYIKFLTGANAGITRTIRQYANASGQILFFIPLPNAPAVGDTFTAYPGCDKQQSTCSGKFGNLVNFSGKPYIPIPETSV